MYIEMLLESQKAEPKKFILIGHSLGAHIMGFAGSYINEKRHKKVGIITGLDPARPCFVDRDKRYRLDPTDAELVEAIHTSREKENCM
jgi:predicted alpha/beta hydrolase